MTELINEWQQFLAQDANKSNPDNNVTSFIAPLNDLGLIAITGDDAASFLHNQLTNDVTSLDKEEARLAGYCTAKGRLLATMLLWRADDGIMLQVPRTILPALQKRLQMFVLRAKAKLRDASDDYVQLGLSGETVGTLLQNWFPELPATPYETRHTEAGTLIRHPGTGENGTAHFQWITSSATAIQVWPQLRQSLHISNASAWDLQQIHAGIPGIMLETQEKFVPQMVNLELIGGVNFKKGCYPGQEIVARSQYLGKLKRRTLLASIAESSAVSPGMEVFSSQDPEQPCGMIVNAAQNSAAQIDCLVEVKLAATENGTIHLGSATGAALHFKALPYAFPDSES